MMRWRQRHPDGGTERVARVCAAYDNLGEGETLLVDFRQVSLLEQHIADGRTSGEHMRSRCTHVRCKCAACLGLPRMLRRTVCLCRSLSGVSGMGGRRACVAMHTSGKGEPRPPVVLAQDERPTRPFESTALTNGSKASFAAMVTVEQVNDPADCGQGVRRGQVGPKELSLQSGVARGVEGRIRHVTENQSHTVDLSKAPTSERWRRSCMTS